MKRILAVMLTVLMLIFALAVGASAADVKELTSAELLALAQDGVITFTEDIAIKGKLTFSEDIKLDLNGYTLTVTEGANSVTQLNTVTIENGTVCIDNVKATASDGILLIGQRSKSGGKLILNEVTVNGKNIMSAAGTFVIYYDGTLEMNGCTVNIENEEYFDAAVFYSNGIDLGKFNITDSEINLVNGSKGFYTGQVNIKDSTVKLNVSDHGFNGDKALYIVDGSEVTITPTDSCKGRGVGIYGSSVMELKNGAKVDITNNVADEGCIVYKSGYTGGIKMDGTSALILQGERPLVLDATDTVISGVDLFTYINIPDTVIVNTEGTKTGICAHGTTETRNATDATCESKGYSGDVYCLVCENLVEGGVQTEYAAHVLRMVRGVAATSEKEGVKEHYVCDECETLFADENAETEIEEKDTVIPKLESKKEQKQPENPKTAEDNSFTVWAVLFALSAIFAVAVSRYRVKKNEK